MKIVFNDLNTSYNYIELSIDGGLTWTQYLVSDVIENGITLDDEQEYDKLQIRGSNSVIDCFHVYKNIEIPEHHTFIGVYDNIAELENTPNLPYDNDFAFVIGKDELGNERLDRYRYNGLSWIFEYSLNNTNFTREQWESINSTITKSWREQVDSELNAKVNRVDISKIEDKLFGDVSELGNNLSNEIDIIKSKMSTQASSTNVLVDKDFVNSSISTNTSYFIGTFNSLDALQKSNKSITKNDYAFIVEIDNAGNTKYNRYKYDGSEWVFEYSLNNSGFTAEQWKSINSGTTSDWKENVDSSLTDLLSEIDTKADSGHTHSDKVNHSKTTMVGLGFEKDTYVPVRDFWQTLYEKCGSNGVVTFGWANATAAYIGTEKSNVYINGGTLVYTMSNKPAVWNVFSALYVSGSGGQFYHIKCSIDADNTVGAESWFVNGIANSYELANKVDKDLSNVTGTLPISKGGTGATTANGSQYNLLKDMVNSDVEVIDDTIMVYRYTEPNSTKGTLLYKKASLFWDYIKGKISSILGLTKDSYGGTSAKATADGSGNNIVNTYATKTELNGKSNSSHTHSNYEPISSTETITSSASKTPSTTVKYIITSNVILTLNKTNVKAGITVMVVAAVACKVTYYKHNSSSPTTMSLAADTMETFISTGNGYVASKTSQMWLT